jgi:hypothetical protein
VKGRRAVEDPSRLEAEVAATVVLIGAMAPLKDRLAQ